MSLFSLETGWTKVCHVYNCKPVQPDGSVLMKGEISERLSVLLLSVCPIYLFCYHPANNTYKKVWWVEEAIYINCNSKCKQT